MSESYVGEIRMFAGNFAPTGWAFCHGQSLPISENETLFMLIGTTYGGDGQNTFNLPDLRSRVPIHQSVPQDLGAVGGVEEVTLTIQHIPVHTHGVPVSTSSASSRSSVGGVPAALPAEVAWTSAPATEPMGATSAAGGSQPHSNLQPYLAVSFIIALEGYFPSPT